MSDFGFSENAVKTACMLFIDWHINYDVATKKATANGKEIPLAPIIELELSNIVTHDQQTGDIALTDWAREYLKDSATPEEWATIRELNPIS